MKVKELISKNIPCVKTDDKIAKVIVLIENTGVSHLPVVREGEFLGLISEEEISQNNNQEAVVSDYVLERGDVVIQEDRHVYDLLKIFADTNCSLVPVLNASGQYSGAVLVSDFMNRIGDLCCIETPGTIIVFELNIIDYSLAEIAQIVEYNDSKILSLYSRKDKDSKRLLLTLKIQSENIVSVIDTFNRYNYTIKEIYFDKADDTDVYEKRYDNLMKYLNI